MPPTAHYQYSFSASKTVRQKLELASLELDPRLNRLAQVAFESAPSPLVQTEHATQALEVLLKFSLVVERLPATIPPAVSPIAHVIANILNCKTPPPQDAFTATIAKGGEAMRIQVLRRKLLLRELSALLRLEIYLFSSRSKACQFKAHDARTTVVLFHNLDSYYYTSEFLVLAASTRSIKLSPPSARHLLSFKHVAPFNTAEFRTDRRKSKRRAEAVCLTTEDRKGFLKRACIETLDWEVQGAVATLRKKRIGKSISVDQLLEEGREKLRVKLLAAKRLPPGVFDRVTELANEAEGRQNITVDMMKNRAGDAESRLHEWRAAVRVGFTKAWTTAVDSAGEDPESSSSNVNDDDEDAAALRTCTATLRQILRPELSPQYTKIINLADESHTVVTMVMEEMATATLKMVHVIASGHLYDDTTAHPPPLNLETLLPAGFEVRDREMPASIAVAPLPPWLQDHLDNGSQAKDDLAKLLSHPHLEFVYARILRKAHPTNSRAEAGHPVWTKAMPLLYSDDALKAQDGLCHTISTHLKQFATGISNLWEGATYYKSLGYLLRILLRLHLAPERERRQRERTQARLCDELAGTMDVGNPVRAQAILSQLYDLQQREPTAICGDLPDIEDQLARKTKGKSLDSAHSIGTSQTELSETSSDEQALVDEFADLDDIGDLDDFEDTGEVDGDLSGSKESTRPQLLALEKVLKMLLGSPALTNPVDGNYVAKCTHKGKVFTSRECNVVAYLANVLRPFVPKRRIGESGRTVAPLGHVALRAPVVMIANAVLRATGFAKFTRLISPQVSPSSTHSLCLGTREVYEVFCGQAQGRFDIKDPSGVPITSVSQATSSPENKKAIFGSFLDLVKVANICKRHGLEFSDRITFVDRQTIRITGKVIPHGSDRQGYPQQSQYEARKKGRLKRTGGRNWAEEFERTQLIKEDVEVCCVKAAEILKDAEAQMKVIRKDLAVKDRKRTEASQKFVGDKRAAASSDQRKVSYAELQCARQDVREARTFAMPKEEALRRLRYESYFWNNVLTAAKSDEKTKSTVKPSISPNRTEVTWMNSTIEEATELLDVSKLINSDQGRIVFAGTDYGICKMSVTVPQTVQDIQVHLNRYAALQRDDEARIASDVATEETDNPSTYIQSLLLPASNIITAPLMNDISHSRKNMKRREQRLRKSINSGVREALQELSKREQVLRTAQSVEEVEQVRKAQRVSGSILKAFENTNARRKDLRNQRLRTVRAWTKVGAAERLFVKTHVVDIERAEAELDSPQDADVSKDENNEMESEGKDMRGEDAGQDIKMVEAVSQVDGWCMDCQCHHIPRAISGKAFAHVKKCPRHSLSGAILPVMLT
ncbi:hypothetical protein BGZ99_009999, partial [Dissophora globulifera]